jgi:hypothetical protein
MELTLPKPPRETANPSPPRPPGSIRRTSSIDVSWPEGAAADRVFHGVARDLITPAAGGEGSLRAAATMEAIVRPDRTIAEIEADPEPAGLQELVGAKVGGHLRMLMQQVLPELIEEADPLYLLLDDISGVSLVSSWAWSLWDPEWLAATREAMGGNLARMLEERADVCWGLQRGHSGLDPQRRAVAEEAAHGGELRNPADPGGWHAFPALDGVTMRRARRIDVWRDAETGRIEIDSAFQDSAPRPDGSRAALHEYRLRASADPDTLELLVLDPEARVLPFYECPGAIPNARALVGSSLPQIRESVLSDLRGPRGCTHLNDALRALADVPKLLEALGKSRSRPVD